MAEIFFNMRNQNWKSKLNQDIQTLLESKEAKNYMANFPNYATVGQNKSSDGWIAVPELLLLNPAQINLLADMWCYTIAEDESASRIFKSLI